MYPEVSLFLKKISDLNCAMLIKPAVTKFAKSSWQARPFPLPPIFGGDTSPPQILKLPSFG